MPLVVRHRKSVVGVDYHCSGEPLRIALVNNMPDAALEDTEMQFAELLRAASCELPVELTFFSIPTVPRGERTKERIRQCYFSVAELLCSRFDGTIITGTEPRQSDLKKEPYWEDLAAVLDWCECFSQSAILSCLAAHAAVLHSDRILRKRLEDKLFGVFAENKLVDHPLTAELAGAVYFPHSRWNSLATEDLVAAGYTPLTEASQVGVGLFVKQKKKSLFIYFQGHPEYSTETLLKEYRRDVRRFLVHERETYPALPNAYFDERIEDVLDTFASEARLKRDEAQMERFPSDTAVKSLVKSWHGSSVTVYRNWLRLLAGNRQHVEGKRVSVQSAGI
jgi:homoserine O-succinyltransferase/O-acetyltransferase